MTQDKKVAQLYYSTGERIKAGDIVLYLSCEDHQYSFDKTIMKVWDVITTNAGMLVGVALMHPSAVNPAVSIRAIHTPSDDKESDEEPRTFGKIPGGFVTTDTLVPTADVEKYLCLLIQVEQITADDEQNQRLLEESLEKRSNQNNGVALFYKARHAKSERKFERYIEFLEKGLRANYTPAMCELALQLSIGQLMEKNVRRSFSVYQHASSLGDSIATYELAGNYARGIEVVQDINKSVQLLDLAAKQGSWYAISILGSYYRNGWLSGFLAPHHNGYNKVNSEIINYEKALSHYFFIAQNAPKTEKHALMSAQFNLAWMHQEGMGIEQNYEQAVYWYEQSSDLGNIVAINNLADKYEHGLGVEQDLDRAFELYSMAAGQVIAADLSLGRMYLEGRGVAKNLELAKSHLEKVLGFSDGTKSTSNMREEAWQLLESFSENTIFKRAQKILQEPEKYSLKEIQEVESNLQEDLIPNSKELRFNLFLVRAQKGDIAAQSQVGDWYLRGIGTAVNNEEAFKWIYKAHRQDNWYAHYQMGYLYEHGIIVEKDLLKALELYQASLQEITMVPKYINGRLNPEYESLYKSCNEESLVALERVKQLIASKNPKWMFWKRK